MAGSAVSTSIPITSLSTFSAASAVIQFAGQEVGYLQDFNLDENFNTIRVKEIGTPSDAAHVAGFLELTVTARRAFINADTFMSMVGTIDKSALAGVTINTIADLQKVLTNEAYPMTRGAVPTSLVFDIQVMGESTASGATTSTTPAAVSTVVLYTLHQCTFVTRRSSLTTGNIIIYEDCTIFPKYRTTNPNFFTV